MISCLVFSRDRAMQLDALLTSIERHAPRLYAEIVVLYRSDTLMHQLAYLDCFKAHDRVLPWRQSDSFESDVHEFVGAVHGGFVVFHTDDDVFYCDAPTDGIGLPYSLRLGLNTTYCHPLDEEQRIPADLELVSDTDYCWDWTEAELDFAYPFSLNGHVYRVETVRRLLDGLHFDSPNDLEHRGVMRWQAHPDEFGETFNCGPHSVVVSVPANRVNDGYPNPASDNPAWQPDALCERYLAGELIRVEKMDFSQVSGAHWDVPLVID